MDKQMANMLLFQSASDWNIEKYRRAVAAGADIHARSKEGKNFLSGKINCASPQLISMILPHLVRYLRAIGPEVLSKIADADLLFEAFHVNSPEVLQVFLDAKIDLAMTNSEGQNLLHHAAQYRTEPDNSLLDALLAANVSLKQVDNNGNTPLHIAVIYGNVAGVQKMLVAGADPNVSTETSISPYALYWQGYEGSFKGYFMLSYLLDHGAEVDTRIEGGLTPLIAAAQYLDTADLTLLLAAGANPLLENLSGHTAYDLCGRSLNQTSTKLFRECREKLHFAMTLRKAQNAEAQVKDGISAGIQVAKAGMPSLVTASVSTRHKEVL